MKTNSSARVVQLAKARYQYLRSLRPGALDIPRLEDIRTHSCNPFDCGGRCCADGAGLLPKEVELLLALIEEHGIELLELGLEDDPGIVTNETSRTDTRMREDGRTACSWLLADGRCSLQTLSTQHGHDPWFYKPLACILFPLRVRSIDGVRVLTVDSRVSRNCSDAPDCAVYDANLVPFEGLQAEVAFIAEIWDQNLEQLIRE